jgi:hypothetical protein
MPVGDRDPGLLCAGCCCCAGLADWERSRISWQGCGSLARYCPPTYRSVGLQLWLKLEPGGALKLRLLEGRLPLVPAPTWLSCGGRPLLELSSLPWPFLCFERPSTTFGICCLIFAAERPRCSKGRRIASGGCEGGVVDCLMLKACQSAAV